MLSCCILLGWRGQGSFHRPTKKINSHCDGATLHPRDPSPIGQRFCFSIAGQKTVSSFIVCLSYSISPITVGRAVVKSYVSAFQRHTFGGTTPDVSKKIFKRILPSPAHGNSLSSIVWVTGAGWRITPSFHAQPRRILNSATTADCSSVGRVCQGKRSFSLAPTTLGSTSSQITSSNSAGIPAGAKANPITVMLSGLLGRDKHRCNEKSERFSGKIVFGRSHTCPG